MATTVTLNESHRAEAFLLDLVGRPRSRQHAQCSPLKRARSSTWKSGSGISDVQERRVDVIEEVGLLTSGNLDEACRVDVAEVVDIGHERAVRRVCIRRRAG